MPGMNSGLNASDPQVVSAFMTALLHQGLTALLIFATLVLVWMSVRQLLPRGPQSSAAKPAEPAGREVLRIGFGVLWLFDGILQAQPEMAVGLPSRGIEPTAASSPHWVQVIVNWAGTSWSYHPVQTGAAAVWIQIGIGIWLLASSRGWLSRSAGIASVAWGLVVWVFGESFGGIFAPGLSWLTGAPGAVLVYVAAGVLIALPLGAWQARRLGRLTVAGFGAFLVGMAVLQAWPGRGFWAGGSASRPGSLATMTQSMSQLSQPGFLRSLVNAFTVFAEGHGFLVNLVVVVALAAIGLAFISLRPALLRPALIAFTVLCLADWVLVQDFGFLGGLGTDPNSMVPMIVLAAGCYLALVRAPVAVVAPVTEPAVTEPTITNPEGTPGRQRTWPDLLRPERLATVSFRTIIAAGALGVIVLGAAPMAAAQSNPNATPLLAEAIGGATAPLRIQASGFQLTDQNGRQVSLASLHGKVVLLGFFDPVCTTDCPLMGAEFRAASQLLRADAGKVELVGVVLSPTYRSLAVMRAFDQQEGLSSVPNWRYLTGSVSQLTHVWQAYGMVAEDLPAGSMTLHNDVTFVIDQNGKVRDEIDSDPGPGTTATQSSYAVLFANAVQQVLR
jgi:cytochrome oxidase Cu insertion factor (SCO1/SenC/PrrC family)